MVADGDILPSGHVISVIKGEEEERMKKLFFMFTDGAIRANPGNWIFNIHFPKFAKLIYNFKMQPTDIVVTTYPKSGTTWAQEIIWNLVHNPDLTNPAADLSLDARFPNFEADMYMATTGAPPPEPEGDGMKLFAQLCPGMHWSDGVLALLAAFVPAPRMLKCHLPLNFLPPNMLDTCKVCYVAREPRDVLTSFYHFLRLHILFGFRGTVDDIVDLFINDGMSFTPYWSHLKQAWDQRNHPNMCFIYFEDLKSDPESQIRRIDKFLGTNRTDEQIRNIVKHTTFSQMKERSINNPPTSNDGVYFDKEVAEKDGGFFRKGEVGDWKNRFTPAQIEKLNSWMAKNVAQFGDDFKYKV